MVNDRMIAFIGGAQINPYGDLNSTIIGDDYVKPKQDLQEVEELMV